MVNVRLYFKASQLPEGVYQRLMEDRNGENLGESLFLSTFLLFELFDWLIVNMKVAVYIVCEDIRVVLITEGQLLTTGLI